MTPANSNTTPQERDDHLTPVVTDLREIVSAMAKDERVPMHYPMRLGELTDELQDLQGRLVAARRIG